jgi:hypothetical protein
LANQLVTVTANDMNTATVNVRTNKTDLSLAPVATVTSSHFD